MLGRGFEAGKGGGEEGVGQPSTASGSSAESGRWSLLGNFDAQGIAGLCAMAFIATVPIHVVSLDLGFRLKVWFVPLLVGIAVTIPRLPTVVRGLPRIVRFSLLLMVVGGSLGLFASDQMVKALRHEVALLVAVAALFLIVAVGRIPYLGVALRLGALCMATTSVVVAALALGSIVDVDALEQGSSVVGQLAEVAYGDMVVVSGSHVDSNFGALYAVVWLFLIAAIPAERWFGRRADGAVVGLLLLQLVLTVSKTGAVALVAGSLAFLAVFCFVRRTDRVPVAGVYVLLSFAIVGGVVLGIDGGDGHANLQYSIQKRGDQFAVEASDLVAVFADVEFWEPRPPDPLAGWNAGEFEGLSEEELIELGVSEQALGPTLGRASTWKSYFHDFRDHPLTGTGLGTSSAKTYAHNAALDAAGGGGIAALAGWIMFWGGIGVLSIKRIVRRRRVDPRVAALTAFLVASMLLTTLYEPIGMVLAGLVLLRCTPTDVNSTA